MLPYKCEIVNMYGRCLGRVHMLLYISISDAWGRIHMVSVHNRCLGLDAYVIL